MRGIGVQEVLLLSVELLLAGAAALGWRIVQHSVVVGCDWYVDSVKLQEKQHIISS